MKDTRTRMLKSALETFSKHGYAGGTTREIVLGTDVTGTAMPRWIAWTLVLVLLTSTVALWGYAGAITPMTSTPTQSDSLFKVTAQQAADLALGAVPGGTVVEVSRGLEHGRATWEVLILKTDGSGVEIYIDATTGVIIKQENITVMAWGVGSGPTISTQQAVDLALGAVPGGTVVEVSRGLEHGRTTWEVLILKTDGSGVEIYIDATTGAIIKQESVPAEDLTEDEDLGENVPADDW